MKLGIGRCLAEQWLKVSTPIPQIFADPSKAGHVSADLFLNELFVFIRAFMAFIFPRKKPSPAYLCELRREGSYNIIFTSGFAGAPDIDDRYRPTNHEPDSI